MAPGNKRDVSELLHGLSFGFAGLAGLTALIVSRAVDAGFGALLGSLLALIGMILGAFGRGPPRLAEDPPLPPGFWLNLAILIIAGLFWIYSVAFRM